ncbi:TetR/AcrR family transcriptional regulator [Amycolatopsis jiangsuensis]|uniref:AcrR family transcriptional regulator n=1 Tax=Amycolatopsis jiangsuensis TaxID=1181879 RepID=A0A840J420_9PSEU|nr:TetR/AcrR family transcriptional regulator [Amycolatopsis jiangsuensis]MBB4688064.1 AcrR family transcriptional regulator [Amycolatopsis jiangsuensis]
MTDEARVRTPPPRLRERRTRTRTCLRDGIVAAAGELLDETGDESAVTLRSVARRAGITAPSIYRYFPDPPTILLAVAREAFVELAEETHAALDAAGDDQRQRLFACCHAYLRYADDHPGRYRAMFGGRCAPAEVCTQLLTEVLSDDRAADTGPHADAVALWLGLHGLACQRALAPAYPWPVGIADRLIVALARPLGA